MGDKDYLVMVNGMQHAEAQKTGRAIIERDPNQLIRQSFVAAGFPGIDFVNFRNGIGKILCDGAHMGYVQQGMDNVQKKYGDVLAVNFARVISGLNEHTIPYIEKRITFILSSNTYSESKNSRQHLNYIEHLIKEGEGLAMLGQEKDRHLPVTLDAVDFMIAQANAGVKGEVFRLEDFQ